MGAEESDRYSDSYVGLSQRVVRLETEMNTVRSDIGEIKNTLGKMATKSDVESLKSFFNGQHRESSEVMRWIVKVLIIAFIAVIFVVLGIEKFPFDLFNPLR